MSAAPGLRSHSLPIALVPSQHEGTGPIRNASASLLWIDRPFAVTVAHVVDECLERFRSDPGAGVWLGNMKVDDLSDRLLCIDRRHDLATLRLEPEELVHLGDEWTFHNPLHWPAPAAEPGDRVTVLGFPQDQWPAQVQYSFVVEKTVARRFSALMEGAVMPGRLAGLCGGPAFRLHGAEAQFVGVVTEALFHNEVIRCQHARHVDTCGQVRPGG